MEDQRGSGPADWRNPLWAIRRPLVTWRRMLRTTLHLINLSQRYHGSKGSLESRQEEPPLRHSGAPWEPGGECFAPLYLFKIHNDEISSYIQLLWLIAGDKRCFQTIDNEQQPGQEPNRQTKNQTDFHEQNTSFYAPKTSLHESNTSFQELENKTIRIISTNKTHHSTHQKRHSTNQTRHSKN
jgi:hypothetical protein